MPPNKHLNNQERGKLLNYLLERCNGTSPERGSFTLAAGQFNVSISTVARLWHDWVKKRQEASTHLWNTQASRKGRCGRPRTWIEEDVLQAFRDLEATRRSTLRQAAEELQIPRAVLLKLQSEGKLKKVSRKMKPELTETNKLEHLLFCLGEQE